MSFIWSFDTTASPASGGPYLSYMDPTRGSKKVSPSTSSIVFTIHSNGVNGVVPSSIQVYLNGELIIQNGMDTGHYLYSHTYIVEEGGLGRTITITYGGRNFTRGQEILLRVICEDDAAHPMDELYWFKIEGLLFKGPLLPTEIVANSPLTVLGLVESARKIVYGQLVNAEDPKGTVRTCLIQAFRFFKPTLQEYIRTYSGTFDVEILNRNSTQEVEQRIQPFNYVFVSAAEELKAYPDITLAVELIETSLTSNSSSKRLSARCALVFLGALVENGDITL